MFDSCRLPLSTTYLPAYLVSRNMSADAQTAVFFNNKILAQAMTSDLTKVEGK